MKWLWLLVLALGCHALRAQRAEVDWPAGGVVFGAAFEFTTRVQLPFDDDLWLPLEVQLLTREVVASGVERRRYRARCYQVGEFVLAIEPAATLQVRSCLPDPPGALEWPADGWQRARSSSSWLWWALALIAVGSAAAWTRWLRRRELATEPEIATGPTFDALAALRALGLPADSEHAARYYQDLKAIVRRHCAQRFAVTADSCTSEELMQAMPAARNELRPCLSACDVVLFGSASSDRQMHDEVRERAVVFVRATQAVS